MDFEPTPIPGAFLIRPKVATDDRGMFAKIFQHAEFESRGIHFRIAESFYSTSNRHVLRGMHFQVPPSAHEKLVHCTSGRVLDVLLDLRKGSPADGQFFSVELSEKNRRALFIPTGVAHGFIAMEEHSTLVYAVTSAHEPSCDRGIRWDSFGFDWPVKGPVISERDRGFPSLAEFESPFVFGS